MDDVRIISLDGLLRRLEDVLGTDSLLYRRFHQGGSDSRTSGASPTPWPACGCIRTRSAGWSRTR
jgi:hypothetical protein